MEEFHLYQKLKCLIIIGNAIGYLSIKNFIFRIDVFEKVFYLARKKSNLVHFLESFRFNESIGL